MLSILSQMEQELEQLRRSSEGSVPRAEAHELRRQVSEFGSTLERLQGERARLTADVADLQDALQQARLKARRGIGRSCPRLIQSGLSSAVFSTGQTLLAPGERGPCCAGGGAAGQGGAGAGAVRGGPARGREGPGPGQAGGTERAAGAVGGKGKRKHEDPRTVVPRIG